MARYMWCRLSHVVSSLVVVIVISIVSVILGGGAVNAQTCVLGDITMEEGETGVLLPFGVTSGEEAGSCVPVTLSKVNSGNREIVIATLSKSTLNALFVHGVRVGMTNVFVGWDNNTEGCSPVGACDFKVTVIERKVPDTEPTSPSELNSALARIVNNDVVINGDIITVENSSFATAKSGAVSERSFNGTSRVLGESHLPNIVSQLKQANDELEKALTNKDERKDEVIEIVGMGIMHTEEAIASLSPIGEGMPAESAVPLFDNALINLLLADIDIFAAAELLQTIIIALGGIVGGVDDGGGIQCNFSLGLPQTKTMNRLMSKLRDRVESNWTVEHDYIEMFNDNIKELTQIVNRHPALASKLYSERTRFMPSILLLIYGEPVELTTTDVRRIGAILDTISANASPQLEDAIDQIRSDLRSEEIMSSFGISVESGWR